MKAAFSIGVLGVYLLLAIGPQILIHTCGGETDIDIMPVAATDPCGCNDGPSQDACCTIQLVTFHLDEAQKVTVPAVERPVTAPVVLSDAHMYSDVADPHAGVPSSLTPSPPIPISPTILYCTFLI